MSNGKESRQANYCISRIGFMHSFWSSDQISDRPWFRDHEALPSTGESKEEGERQGKMRWMQKLENKNNQLKPVKFYILWLSTFIIKNLLNLIVINFKNKNINN